MFILKIHMCLFDFSGSIDKGTWLLELKRMDHISLPPLFYEISFCSALEKYSSIFPNFHICLKTDRKFFKPGDTNAVLLCRVPVNAPTVLHLCLI